MIIAFNFHRENSESENTTQDGRNLPTNCFVSGFAFFSSEEKGGPDPFLSVPVPATKGWIRN